MKIYIIVLNNNFLKNTFKDIKITIIVYTLLLILINLLNDFAINGWLIGLFLLNRFGIKFSYLVTILLLQLFYNINILLKSCGDNIILIIGILLITY